MKLITKDKSMGYCTSVDEFTELVNEVRKGAKIFFDEGYKDTSDHFKSTYRRLYLNNMQRKGIIV